MWVQLAVMVVMLVLSVALAPKPPQQKPAVLSDFDFPQMDEGTPQCVVFGDCWTGGWMVLSYGNLRSQPIKSGGKK